MNRLAQIKSCLLEGEEDLPDETPLFKYLSIESFLYLVEFRRLNLSRITNWPDAYEGTRFEFFRKIKTQDEFSNNTKDDFYGSCWSLQTEEPCLYESQEVHKLAIDELYRNGSAAMWEAYCKNGGVRIKTTLKKLNALFLNGLANCSIYRGKVFYEPATSWNKTIKTSGLISLLFMKRISFRHEAEYRYILVSDEPRQESIIDVSTWKLSDFLDEILVSPATSSQKWISRTLYHLGVDISLENRICINSKNGNQFCRISQLYGLVSEIVGHGHMS